MLEHFGLAPSLNPSNPNLTSPLFPSSISQMKTLSISQDTGGWLRIYLQSLSNKHLKTTRQRCSTSQNCQLQNLAPVRGYMLEIFPCNLQFSSKRVLFIGCQSGCWSKSHFDAELGFKNIIRDGKSTALLTADTARTVYTAYTAFTAFTAFLASTPHTV